jgi:hypothetical protein
MMRCLPRIIELLIVVYFHRLKINHESHELILESGTVANIGYVQLRHRNFVKKKNQENWIEKQHIGHLPIAQQDKNSKYR